MDYTIIIIDETPIATSGMFYALVDDRIFLLEPPAHSITRNLARELCSIEEVYYEAHPVIHACCWDRSYISETGYPAGIAQPAQNRRLGALTLRERW